MPLYSLIALTLSLFGATFTAIAAVRYHFAQDVAEAVQSFASELNVIQKEYGEGQAPLKKAKAHTATINRWNFYWKASYYVPIFVFWLVTFVIAVLCVWNWPDLPTKVDASNQGALQSSAIAFNCINSICGRVAISLMIVFNFICSALALLSGYKVKNAGNGLHTIFECAEESFGKRKGLAPIAAAGPPLGN